MILDIDTITKITTIVGFWSVTQEYYNLYKQSKEQYLSELNLVCLYIIRRIFY